MKRLIIFLLFALICGSTVNAEKIETADLASYFENFKGCFILNDEANDRLLIYNQKKADIRISPCSTFKIVHSLIGLDTKVLQDENTIIKWDGTQYPIPEWNRDQTLASAVSYSVVWYFQSVATKIGIYKELYYLTKINYGNEDLSGGLTNFWLQSSLKISPLEQLDILRRFYHYELPFSQSNIDIVKKVLVLAKENQFTLSGKTGSGVIDGKNVNGWFVGYIENGGKVYFWVTNIEGENGATGLKAKAITLQILKDKKLL